MKRCPNCHKDLNESVKFCTGCGYSFVKDNVKRHDRRFVAICGSIFLVVIILIGVNIADLFGTRPIRTEHKVGDTELTRLLEYNEEKQEAKISYFTDMEIELWQVEYLQYNNMKKKDLISIEFGCFDERDEKLTPATVDFELGETFNFSFVRKEMTPYQYRIFKKCFLRSPEVFSYYPVTDFNKTKREQAEKTFQKQKRQAEMMNILYGAYYGGYY